MFHLLRFPQRPTDYDVLVLPCCLPPHIYARLSGLLVRFARIAAATPDLAVELMDQSEELLILHEPPAMQTNVSQE